MAAIDVDSDSSLSEAPEEEVRKLAPIFVKAKKATKLVAPPPAASPPRPKRPASPPHEMVLADNPDIALLVMFRSRFNEAFPGKTPQFGPQDIERGVVDSVPSPEAQSLLCALLALVLNRKKPVERGHHGRALEEAIASHRSQWPLRWALQNPIHGGKTFENMTPEERLNLLRTLAIWSLSSSEAVSAVIKEKYKQVRHNDDENQPLSVQPWGIDGDKRRYFLVQGLDDTSFRVYREGGRYTKKAHWYSVAGSIEEVKALVEKLEKVDGSQYARRLSVKMKNAIPMFEATEEKRRRREYRQQRRAAFSRPEPGFGIYEGRTRGKRMRYTYEDDEDASMSDTTSTRRSTRQQSARSTPFESGPTYTASGRQIKQPRMGDYGESLLRNNIHASDEQAPAYERRSGSSESDAVRSGGRSMRSAGVRPVANGAANLRKRKHIDGYNSIDALSDEEDAADSGDEWNSDQNEDEEMPDANEEESEPGDEDEDDDENIDKNHASLVVKLKVPKFTLDADKDGTPPTSPPSAGDGDQKPTIPHPIVRTPPPESAEATAGAEPSSAVAPAAKNSRSPQVILNTSQPSQAAHHPGPSTSSQNGGGVDGHLPAPKAAAVLDHA